ncbi:2-oxo-4-hydroxy-4-carboxy-5-ureidoimidazoline decarboxylase [Alkalihalobacillus sp. 1P02AB]|uniref:2-oxo-4-hydroxy-4-carboxy-5-ureidoimidazoline decarboxylase n=1 Tax=Alkalihalobacillus sp. 1P02AB TaxID=3132260 RepID=UPI0039A4C0A9
MHKYSLEEVNQMSNEDFIQKIGHVFEDSPWVAEKTYGFAELNGVDQLKELFTSTVFQASEQEQLFLLRAHPDLGAKLEMTDHSVKEQQSVGLNVLSKEEYEFFFSLNQRYMKRFGFPFIIAVKEHTKESIKEQMLKRVEHSYDKEKEKALKEVCKIAGYRLDQMLKE